jgi:hypothetical protein
MSSLAMGGLFWELQRVSGAAATDAEIGREESMGLGPEIDELTDRVDKLTIACMALWSFLKKETGLTDEDLMAKFREIDLLDGKEDGKVSPQKQVRQCAKCGRAMSRRHARCLYCGARNLETTVLERIT